MIEAKKLAYEDRAKFYADMEKARVPVKELISKLLAVYSAGLGIPFLLAAFMIERFSSLFARMKRHLDSVERAMGVLMVITGIGFFAPAPSPASPSGCWRRSRRCKISATSPLNKRAGRSETPAKTQVAAVAAAPLTPLLGRGRRCGLN